MTSTSHAEVVTAAPVRPTIRLLAGATVVGTVLNWALEIIESILASEVYAAFDSSLLKNLAVVALWSFLGFLVAVGLVRLGHGTRSTPMSWVLVVLALLTVLPLFFVAVPASLAAGAYSLAEGSRGSAPAVRVLAVIAFAAFVVVSVGMFPFSEV